MTSTYYTVIRIHNKLTSDLTGGTAKITTGKLSGKLPATITSGTTTADIRVNADNGSINPPHIASE